MNKFYMIMRVLFQKRKIAFYLSVVLLIACENSGKIKIKGNLLNATNEMIFLKEMTITEVINVDSVKIDKDGDFVLQAMNKNAAFYSLYLSKNREVTLILFPGDRIKITGDAQKLQESYSIEGSQTSLEVKELNDKLRNTLSKVDELRKIYEDSLGSKNILKVRHTLDSIYDQIETEHIAFTQSFIKKYTKSLSSVMALYQQLGPRKPVLNPKDHYEYFTRVDSSMMLLYPDADAVESLHTLIADIREQRSRQIEIEKRTSIGVEAPEIVLNSFNGDTVKLSMYKGRYVLLDFWASWCNPCRLENPFLIKAYYKYKFAGFEIFQVSLDKDREAWIKAISTDRLPWLHGSDLKMWNSPVVSLYGIESIPSNFLLNKEGIIIAKNLRGEELSNKLKEIFNY